MSSKAGKLRKADLKPEASACKQSLNNGQRHESGQNRVCRFTKVVINGLNCRALVDSGSVMTIISKKTFKRLQLSNEDLQKSNVKLTAANGVKFLLMEKSL